MTIIYSVDLTAQDTQVFGSTGPATIDDLTWYAKGSLSSGSLERGLLSGSGLYIGTVSGFTQPLIGTSADLTFPCMFLPLANVPGFDPTKAYLVRGRFDCTIPGNVSPLVGVADTTSDGANILSTQRARDRLCGPTAGGGPTAQINHKLGTAGITIVDSLATGVQNQRVCGVYHLSPRFAAVGTEILASGMPSGLITFLPVETAPVKDYATVANPGVLFATNFSISAAGGGATRAFLTHLQVELVGDVSDTTPPTVTLVSPAASPLTVQRRQPVVFELEDDSELKVITIWVRYPTGATEVIYAPTINGTSEFQAGFAESTVSGTNPRTFTILRAHGWPFPPQIFVQPVDAGGNVAI